IFSLRGPAIIAHNSSDHEWLLAFLNSRSAEVFVVMQAATRRWELAQIMRIPVPEFSLDMRFRLAKLARECCLLEHEDRTWDETSRYFQGVPWLEDTREGIGRAAESLKQRLTEIEGKVGSCLDQCEAVVQSAYKLTEPDVLCVHR